MSRFVLTAQLQLQAPNNVAQVVRQIQSQLNNVTVNVQVQGAQQAQRQIQQITQNTNNATTAAERMGRAFAVSVRRFAAFSIATRAVGLFTSTLGDAVQTAIDFERQLVKISQVTGESVSKLSKLTSTITDLSTGLGVSSQSLLEVSTILLQAGLNSKDTEVALKSLARAALAPNFDSITETAEGAIAILAQFQEGVGSLEKQLGSINAVAGAFAVEASDLIDVIRRTGGVFKASGGDLNELLALFTSVRATTRESAESIGTGLRTIFTRIQRPQTIEFLKQFGVELVDLEGKFVGPFEAVKRLSGALAGLGEGDLTFIRVAEELGGFRQIGKVLPLLQQFSTAQAALNVAQKSGNSLAQDAATAQQALAIRITKVKEEFLALVRSVTETATFQIMANTALSLATSLIKLADSIKPLLPLLGALAAIRIARGLGSFLGGIGGGLASARTFNKGGKVHHFARGGMVPGTGNRDTVPAMLSPGEFVIRKSSVQKLGAANLAAMNENRFNKGIRVTKAQQAGMSTSDVLSAARSSVTIPRFAKESSIGIATTSYLPSLSTGNISVTREDILNQIPGGVGTSLAQKFGAKEAKDALGTLFKGKNKFNYSSVIEGVGKDEESKFANIINESISSAIDISANRFATEVMGSSGPLKINKLQSFYNTLDQGFRGQLFESTISALAGKPLSGQDSRRPIDFTRGIGKFKSIYSNLGMDYVDAKITSGAAGLGKTGGLTSSGSQGLASKIAQQLSLESMPFINSLIPQKTAEQKQKELTSKALMGKGKAARKHFGGIIQKFAKGGIAQAPLIDDIVNATGTMMPRPSSAIAALIHAGGGAIDIDRTIKRTVGDKAYGTAKTSGQQSAVLDKFFRDPQARLRDVTSAPLTTFGKELQAVIKSGQLQPGKLSIVSKSQRVPGVAEYLSNLFGIPLANMIFTGGGSKQPAMDALRSKGPRASRVARFATGGEVGKPQLYTRGSLVYSIDDMKAAAKRKGITLEKLKELMQERKINPRTGAESLALEYYDLEKQFGLLSYKPQDSSLYQKTMAAKIAKEDRIETWRQKQGLGTREYEGRSERQKGFLAARQRRRGFATGGGVGTDTVPALLTPGEFVINRSAAQNIGYGALNRMNKVGRYAKGGVVQKFAAGTTGTGAKPIISDIGVPGLNTKAPSMLNRIISQLTGTFSVMDINMQATARMFDQLQRRVPNLVNAIMDYSSDLGLTSSQSDKLIAAYHQVLYEMNQNGATNDKIQAAADQYIQALRAASQSAGAVSGASPTSSTATLSRPASPMGSPGSIPGMNANTSAVVASTRAHQSAAQSAMNVANNNKLFAASVVTSLIQGFLPAVDENSSTLLVFSQQLLSSVVTLAAVSAGLEAFGISLSKDAIAGAIDSTITAFQNLKTNGILTSISSIFSQTTATAAQTVAVSANTTAVSANTAAQASQASAGQNLAGGLQAGLIATTLITGAFYTLFGTLKEMNRLEKERAIKLGDVKGAGDAAAGEAGAGVRQVFGSIGAGIGGVIGTALGAFGGSIIPGAGTVAAGAAGGAVGATAGGATGLAIAELFGFSQAAADAARLQAEIAAMNVNTNKAMAESSKKATSAMEDFSKGTLSAKEALDATDSGNTAVLDLAKKTQQANVASESAANNRWFFRGSAQRKAKQENELRLQDVQKSAQEQLSTIMPALQANMRTTAAQGGDFDDFTSSLSTAQFELLNLVDGGIENAYKSFVSISKEIERSRAALEAMNLGLRGPEATASAMSASMARFAAGFESGGSAFVANTEFLSQAMTSAAQAMDQADIKSAIGDVRQNLEKLGIDPKYAQKVEDNILGFTTAQKNYNTAFNKIRADINANILAGRAPGNTPEAVKKAFAEELTAGLGDEAKKNLQAIINNIELSPDEVNKLLDGDLSVFGDKLSEAGRKQIEQIQKIAADRQKAEQVIIQLTQKRIEAERKLVEAQQEALDLYLEGREVQAGAGGMAVTGAERRGVILGKANVEGDRLGLSGFRSGSAEELRRRNIELRASAATYEQRARTEGGLQGASGVEASEQQRDLQKAYRTQIDTIRSLIKLEQDELKIIQEKNKLEKQSMESLISGDIEKFFEQQAAVGAQAAIASGNQEAMNRFGASALATAYQDIQRQMEAGVQSMFGVNLGGAGGLAEQAAQAALSARGVTSLSAAQSLAGTTPEEEGKRARIRELGGVLSETGQVGIDMAQMEVNTASFIVKEANIKLGEIIKNGNEVASGFARGGMVYASRGMFVPRGTDTVPAMLTPGEFVVNRRATQNNLQLLKAINNGNNVSGSKPVYANRGGKIRGGTQYLSQGGMATQSVSLDPQVINSLTNALTTFNKDLATNVANLQNTKFQIKLETANINVNFQGASFLSTLREQIQQELFSQLAKELANYRVGPGGNIVKSQTVLG